MQIEQPNMKRETLIILIKMTLNRTNFINSESGQISEIARITTQNEKMIHFIKFKFEISMYQMKNWKRCLQTI